MTFFILCIDRFCWQNMALMTMFERVRKKEEKKKDRERAFVNRISYSFVWRYLTDFHRFQWWLWHFYTRRHSTNQQCQSRRRLINGLLTDVSLIRKNFIGRSLSIRDLIELRRKLILPRRISWKRTAKDVWVHLHGRDCGNRIVSWKAWPTSQWCIETSFLLRNSWISKESIVRRIMTISFSLILTLFAVNIVLHSTHLTQCVLKWCSTSESHSSSKTNAVFLWGKWLASYFCFNTDELMIANEECFPGYQHFLLGSKRILLSTMKHLY